MIYCCYEQGSRVYFKKIFKRKREIKREKKARKNKRMKKKQGNKKDLQENENKVIHTFRLEN